MKTKYWEKTSLTSQVIKSLFNFAIVAVNLKLGNLCFRTTTSHAFIRIEALER